MPSAAEVLAFARALTGRTAGLGDAQRIDLIRALERVKCAAEGLEAVVTAELDASQRQCAADRGESRERQGRGIAHQVALARRESPSRGQRHLGLAKVMVSEMPHALHALRHGHITEWKATLLARETACLGRSDRQRIDREVCGDPERAERMGDRELAERARRLAAELDPAAVAARRRRAEADRHVTIRPAPDTMTWLTGHLPVRQGVAVYAALRSEADRLAGAGDDRSRGQIMADTLVARVLGEPAATGIRVNVVIGADALLASTDDAAEVMGYGPVPARTVREWVGGALAAGAEVELRRLFAAPDSGQLVATESRAGRFPRALADLIALRDQRCRAPWCDARVRHADHVVARVDGGPTSLRNGQGLCEACNYAKQAAGWTARPRPGPGHEVETVTPTGHRYRSRAPDLAGCLSPGEQRLAQLLGVA